MRTVQTIDRPYRMTNWAAMSQFTWRRAHAATSEKWKTFWFNHFETAVTFADMERRGATIH